MGTVFVHETAFQLNTSPFWTTLTQAAQHDPQGMLVVTPSAEHKTVVYNHLKGISGLLPRVLSLDELIFEAEGKNSQDSRPLFLMLLESLLAKAYDRSASEKTEGFLTCLLDLHYTLFHHDVSLDQYVRSHPPHLRDRASRYADFLSDFRSALANSFPLNRFSVYDSLRQQDCASIREFCEGKHLYFYGFLSLEPYQSPVLETLFSISASASVLLPYHDDYSCFELTRRTKDWLSQLNNVSVHCIPSTPPELPDTLTVYESDAHEQEGTSLASLVSELQDTAPCSIAQLSSKQSFSSVFREFQIPFSAPPTGHIHPYTSFVLSLLNLLQFGLSTERLITLLASPYAQQWTNNDEAFPLSTLPLLTFSHRLTDTSYAGYAEQLKDVLPLLEELDTPFNTPPFLEALDSVFSALALVLSSETASQWQHHFKALLSGFVPEPNSFLDDTHYVIASLEHTLETFVFSQSSAFEYRSGAQFSGLVRRLFQEWHPDGLHDSTSSTHFTTLESLQWRPHHHRFVPQCSDSLLPQHVGDNPLFPESAQTACRVSLNQTARSKQWFAFCQLVADNNVVFSYPKAYRKNPGFASHFFDLIASEFDCKLSYTSLGRGTATSQTENQIASPSLPYSRTVCTFSTPPSAFTNLMETHTFSASQLDAYQACPTRYFLKYTLKLQPYETTQGDVAAHEWGALVHAIFQDYNTEKKDKGSHQHSLERLTQIAHQHFDATKLDTLQWDVKDTLLFGTDGTDGLLKAYVDIENDLEYSSDPLAVEHPFLLTEPIPLKGVIDAVFGINGLPQTYVLDYKTGKGIPSATDVRLYRNLQLSVYMLASQILFPDKVVVGASIFQLNSEKHVGKHIVCSTDEARKELFKLGRKRPFIFDDTFYAGLKLHLRALSTAIKQGLFDTIDYEHLGHMSSRSSTCFSCDYKHQCHYKERFIR